MSERPDYLKPVPDAEIPAATDGATALAPQAAAEHEPGLTPPLGIAHSGMFTTDVLVELGFIDKERAALAVEEAHGVGRTPESILIEQKIVDSNQVSRAVAERY